ncbi:MAG: hypothetical protein OXL37_04855 [Chloroflexota bacterium]|nr:hypothetical protein [Chloroflexota bacterium]MDE2961399.1 hypothetical protein [Chloroflexota bacterium]
MTTPIRSASESRDTAPQPQGLTIKISTDMGRVQATCPHQSGLIYAVPGDRSWVCTDELRPAHAMAGFFRELIALKDPRVESLMQQWGLYYRSLPLESEAVEGEAGS